MALVNDIIRIARAQLGIKESPAGSNKCKYTQDYGVVTAWCVIFIWWCFRQAGMSALLYDGKKVCSCSVLRKWAQTKGQWISSGYRPGDLLMYNFSGGKSPQHIGICVAVSGKTITAIEGNTGIGNEANGGQVQQRTRSINLIVGAVRPRYTTDLPSGGDTVNIKLPVLKRGARRNEVKALQQLLNAEGASLNIDGSFGPATDAALRKYQKSKGLAVDGSCGQKTWTKILKVV